VKLTDEEIYKMLELEVGKPVIPKVEQKINNHSLLLLFRDGSIQILNTEFGYTDLDHMELYKDSVDMKKGTGVSPSDYPYDVTRKVLGKVILTAFPNISQVRLMSM
jgi:hypothetical protein